MENALPAHGFVRAKQLLGDKKKGIVPIIPVAPSTLWRMVKEGKFPAPIKLGESTTVWNVDVIRAYLAAHK